MPEIEERFSEIFHDCLSKGYGNSTDSEWNHEAFSQVYRTRNEFVSVSMIYRYLKKGALPNLTNMDLICLALNPKQLDTSHKIGARVSDLREAWKRERKAQADRKFTKKRKPKAGSNKPPETISSPTTYPELSPDEWDSRLGSRLPKWLASCLE